jgi:hypothetical protein
MAVKVALVELVPFTVHDAEAPAATAAAVIE